MKIFAAILSALGACCIAWGNPGAAAASLTAAKQWMSAFDTLEIPYTAEYKALNPETGKYAHYSTEAYLKFSPSPVQYILKEKIYDNSQGAKKLIRAEIKSYSGGKFLNFVPDIAKLKEGDAFGVDGNAYVKPMSIKNAFFPELMDMWFSRFGAVAYLDMLKNAEDASVQIDGSELKVKLGEEYEMSFNAASGELASITSYGTHDGKRYQDYLLSAKDYKAADGLKFPSEVFIAMYAPDSKPLIEALFKIDTSAMRINSPAGSFIPALPAGTLVKDHGEKKTYTVTEIDDINSKEEAIISIIEKILEDADRK